jgi:SPP1 family predicted phage head-tail adaptor
MAQSFTPAGQRNRRITIQSQGLATPDPVTGAPGSGWTALAGMPIWAKIAGASSKEVFQAGQFTAQITHLINVLWSASLIVSGGMQVLYVAGGVTRTFTIQAVENANNEANRELNLMCIEIDGVTS